MEAEPSRRRASTPEPSHRFSNSQWPTRTRRLIEELHVLASGWLCAPLQRALENFTDHLFEQAERARNGIEQQAYMNSRETLLRGRKQVEKAFIESIARSLERIGEPCPAPVAGDADLSLSLINPVEQEMTATLEKITARGISRAGPTLFELGYRLAVLIGSPPLEGADQPLGPQALTTAFRDATAPLELPSEHDLQLFACFDHELMRRIGPFYEMINRHLLADGLLPQLRAYSVAPAPARHGAASRQAHAEGAPAQHSGAAGTSPGEPIAVLDSLRELLAQRRSGGTEGYGDGAVASTEELQTALDALQQHLSQVTAHASRELRSAQLLRKELLEQLNAGRPAGSPPTRLSTEQNDTVELVAMLFEHMGKQVPKGGNARSVLGGLELPMLRMAVTDHDFFEKREHPARRFLGTVTEAADEWLDAPGGEPDRGIQAKLEQLIERASHEPPSAGLYTSLLADIENHLGELKLRAQAAEKRHVKAMQGRERLDQACRRAAALMAERFARSSPHGLQRALLNLAWTDVLTLTLVRHGEKHPACVARLAMTDQLLGLAPVTDRAQLQRDVQAGLRQIGMSAEEAALVTQCLTTQGKKARPQSDDAPSATALVMRLKQQQRLGEHPPAHGTAPAAGNPVETPSTPQPSPAATPAPPGPETRPAPPADTARNAADHGPVTKPVRATKAPRPARAASIDPREKSLRQRLRKLPFGTWFECIDADTGRTVERKLAWYSTMSGQALLVNRRGRRSEEVGLDELARRIAHGRMREKPDTRENMLDRAWRGLTSNLRRASQSHAGLDARGA